MDKPIAEAVAQAEWDKIKALVDADIERQIDDHTEERKRINGRRSFLGLPPI